MQELYSEIPPGCPVPSPLPFTTHLSIFGSFILLRVDMYAEVALPVAVDRTFTYLVPPDLPASSIIGVRVIVPFGRKYSTGVVVGLSESTSLPAVKPLHDVLDPSPIIPGDVLRLSIWIADYYCAPLGETIRAALPQGFAASSRRTVYHTLSDQETVAAMEKLRRTSPKRAKLLSLLYSAGEMSARDLQKRTGLTQIHSILNDLEWQGLLRTEERIARPAATTRMAPWIHLAGVDPERLSFEMLSLSPRKRKARQLLASVRQLHDDGKQEIAVADLLKQSGTSSAVLRTFLSSGLLPVLSKEVIRTTDYGSDEQSRNIILNDTQREVLSSVRQEIEAAVHATFLLHGVTGSGKTQVYIEAIRLCLAKNRSAVVLVPEIALTPQTVRRFKSHFGETVAVVHSRMSVAERHDVWRLALRGDRRIVIGPRSAVFAPVRDLGLIVVDEEHEASYKQYDATPRYNARDAAIMRASFTNSVVILGSATPSAESYANALQGKYALLRMPDRVDAARLPDISIVDMTTERKREYEELKASLPEEKRRALKEFQQSSVSGILREKIRDRLEKKEGVILLQNRRGFAPFIECPDCGYTETCDHCNVSMTYHLTKKHLRCHYCGSIRQPHAECPLCGGNGMRMHGAGTQRVEQDLAQLFPEARVVRMDLDTTSRKGAHHRILQKFGTGEADILLGTQMVAKGLDFPHVTLVGVISADVQLLLPDFRASERTFQLLTQVAGRAGRSTLHGEVIIQTHQKDNTTLRHVLSHDFGGFYEEELQQRRELDYPPFSRLALIESKGPSEESVRRKAEEIARRLRAAGGSFSVLGPAPAVLGKLNNQYRWHVILKARKSDDPSGAQMRHALRAAIGTTQPSRVRLIVDVDPVGLM